MKQFYWAVVPIVKNSEGKSRRVWPMTFHFRQRDLRDELHQRNSVGRTRWEIRRFAFEFKGTHYDIYNHEFRRTEK